MAIALGINAKTYYGVAGNIAMNLITNIKDVTIDAGVSEADTTTRANQGWDSITPVLRSATVTFNMQWDTEDAAFVAIRNTYMTSSLIALRFSDGTDTGLDADFAITGFNVSQTLRETLEVSVTAKLSVYRDWI